MNMPSAYLPLGSITTAQVALTTRLRKTVLDTLVAGTYVRLPASDFLDAAFELREISDGNADDSNVVNMYSCRGVNDDYSLVATLTGAQGTQTYKGKADEFYADTLTVTSLDAGFNVKEASTAANNIAKVRFLAGGQFEFLFIATTLATTTLKIQVAPTKVHMLNQQGPWPTA